VSAAEEVPK